MNTAARIESAAPVDGILLGELTYRATRELFEYREADPIAAKGKSEPVPVWEVVGSRNGAAARATETPLVGREIELDRSDQRRKPDRFHRILPPCHKYCD